MQTFRLTDDNNRLYFRNYERVAPEEELEKVIACLKSKNIKISNRREVGLDDIYNCMVEGLEFSLIYTREETFLYSDDEGCIDKLENMINVR